MTITIKTLQEIPEDVQNEIDVLYTIAGYKYANYRPNAMKEPTLATTVVYEDDWLVGIGSIIMRKGYNVPRIMHRYYYNDGTTGLIPKNFNGKIRTTTVEMIDQQVELVEKLGYKGCFTSRDPYKGFQRFHSGINELSKYDWYTDLDNRYEVYKDCWQLIMGYGEKFNGPSKPVDAADLKWKDNTLKVRGHDRKTI